MKKMFLPFILAFGITFVGRGQLITFDDFNYADNSLLTANGWVAHSGTGTAPIAVGASNGLTYTGYSGIAGITGVVTGNAAKLVTTGEDDSKLFPPPTPITTGTIYFTFLVNVTTGTAGYFIHLGGSATAFAARLFVKPSLTSGKINFGISNTSTAAFATTPTDFDPGTTYLIIIKYDVSATGAVSLWVKSSGIPTTEVAAGTPEVTTSGTGQTSIDRICLRQYVATQNMTIDGIRVGHTWAEVLPSGEVGTPTKLIVTSVNGGSSPTAGVPFSVAVQAQDDAGLPQPVTSDVNITLSGTGIGGTTTGTILNGQNNVIISGVTMSEGYGLTITATQTSGTPTLAAGTSALFNVLGVNPNYQTKASGNWNAAASWQIQINGVWYDATDFPNASNKNVTILNGHTIIVTDNNGKCKDLTIDGGGKVWTGISTMTLAKYLNVYGNITNNGTIGSSDNGVTPDNLGFDIEGPSCLISGTGTFDAGRISKFTLINTITNVTINMNVTLRYSGVSNAIAGFAGSTLNLTVNPGILLNVTTGKIDLTLCTLLLKSTASGTACLLDNGYTTTGDVNALVERYLTGYSSPTDFKYHIISSPIAAQVIQPEFVNLPNSTDDFYKWDEPTATWINSRDGSGNWNSSFELNFAIGRGYLVAYPSNLTKLFTGSLNTYLSGTPLTLACTFTLPPGDQGWNMLGNPFPSSLDWTLLTRDGIDNALYYYDAGIQNYQYYLQFAPGISVGGGTKDIPPMQGFFVHANNTGAMTLTIDNTMRNAAGLNIFHKESENTPDNYLVLKADNGIYSDEAYVVFFDQATANYDGQYDAMKVASLNPKVPQLYTVAADSSDLAINSLPVSAATTAMPLNFKAGTNGDYTITASELNTFAPEVVIILEDLKTNQTQNLVQNPVYSFTASTGDAISRFLLHFSGPVGINEGKDKPFVNIYSFGDKIYISSEKILTGGSVYVFNLLGQQVIARPLAAQNLNIIPAGDLSGYYLVRVVSDKGSVTGKVFVK